MSFISYHDREFDVDVTSESEQNICNLVHGLNSGEVLERLYDLSQKNAVLSCRPLFQYTKKILNARKTNLIASNKWNPIGDACRELAHEYTRIIEAEPIFHPVEQPLIGPAPTSSFLGSILDGIMTDRIAYSNMDPNKLPSTSFIEEKAKATVLWDITMGNR